MCGIKQRVQVKCKDCGAGLCTGMCLKPTAPNLKHDVVFKGTGNPRTFSPKEYVEEVFILHVSCMEMSLWPARLPASTI
jgi:hypothetical protein